MSVWIYVTKTIKDFDAGGKPVVKLSLPKQGDDMMMKRGNSSLLKNSMADGQMKIAITVHTSVHCF